MKINRKFLYLAIYCLTGCSNSKTSTASFNEVSCEQSLASLNQSGNLSFLEGPYWKYFQDPMLDELQDMLCIGNKTLLAEEYHIKTIFDQVTALKGSILPQASFVFQDFFQYYSRTGVYGSLIKKGLPAYYNDMTTGIGFNWNLDLAGQQKFYYKSMIEQGISKLYKLKGMHLDLSALLSKTYFNLKALINIHKHLKQMLTLAKEQKALTMNLLTYDLANEQKLIDQEKKIKTLEIKLNIVEYNQNADMALLKALVAKMPDEWNPSLSPSLPRELPFVTLEDLKLGLIGQRPDIQMAVHLLNEASLKIKSAKAAFYPNITLTSLSGFESVNFSKLFLNQSQAYTFTPILTLPIFSAGMLNANLRKERHQYESLIHSYDEALLKAAKEVVSFGSKFITTYNEFKNSYQIQILESHKTVLITDNYNTGLVSKLEALEAMIEDHNKAIERYYLQKDFIFSFIDLSSSLGGGL